MQFLFSYFFTTSCHPTQQASPTNTKHQLACFFLVSWQRHPLMLKMTLVSFSTTRMKLRRCFVRMEVTTTAPPAAPVETGGTREKTTIMLRRWRTKKRGYMHHRCKRRQELCKQGNSKQKVPCHATIWIRHFETLMSSTVMEEMRRSFAYWFGLLIIFLLTWPMYHRRGGGVTGCLIKFAMLGKVVSS